jgi:hypothetical protein
MKRKKSKKDGEKDEEKRWRLAKGTVPFANFSFWGRIYEKKKIEKRRRKKIKKKDKEKRWRKNSLFLHLFFDFFLPNNLKNLKTS